MLLLGTIQPTVTYNTEVKNVALISYEFKRYDSSVHLNISALQGQMSKYIVDIVHL